MKTVTIDTLEKFGVLTLAGGLLYSISALIIQSDHFKFHFIVLTFVIFVALLCITIFNHIKRKYELERLDDILDIMKIE